MPRRVLFIGGTGPLGQATVPHLLEAGHEVALAHTGRHEAAGLEQLEHLHGERANLLGRGSPAEGWQAEVLIDTFAGGATAAKAQQLAALAECSSARQVVAVSSIDVYRHCADAGVDDHPPAELARDPLPLAESAPMRGETNRGHDNVAMEAALAGAPQLTILRPGAIYGPYVNDRVLREWYLVGRVARGERRLPLPNGGTQLFHRVALDRVGRAVASAVDNAPEGRFAANVADPRDFTYGALAALVAERLRWEWEPEPVPWAECDHPWNVRHPVVADTARLQQTLGVAEPDPVEATLEQIDWLWENRAELQRRFG
jgi:nucleoside-diphosphate-sugar epimerase